MRSSRSTWVVLSIALGLACLVAFVVAVSSYRTERGQAALWADVTKNRTPATKEIYEAGEGVQDFLRRARDQKEAQMMWPFLVRSMAGAVSQYPDRLAKTEADKLATLKDLAQRTAGTGVGPWLYYHLGNVYYAQNKYADAVAAYQDAERLVKGQPSHLLVARSFDFLKTDIRKAKQQQEWAEKLARRKTDRPKGDNPQVEILTEHGTAKIELFVAESRPLVERFLALVAAGWLDGRPFHDAGFDKAASGCPNGSGKGELGPGLANAILERTHDKGTVSMELHETDKSKASSCRFFIVTRERGEGETTSPYDGKHSIIGQVTQGMDALAKLKAGDRILRAQVKRAGGAKIEH